MSGYRAAYPFHPSFSNLLARLEEQAQEITAQGETLKAQEETLQQHKGALEELSEYSCQKDPTFFAHVLRHKFGTLERHMRFPVLLTRKYACDKAVSHSSASQSHTGNSPTALRNSLHEIHNEEYERSPRLSQCLSATQEGVGVTYLPVPTFKQPSLPPPFHKSQ